MKSNTYPLYMCTSCKTKVDFEDIRYDKDGKNLICHDCYESTVKKKSSENESQKKIKIEYEQRTYPSEVVKLICKDCRYKFSLAKVSRINLACPYCGGKKLMDDDTTAERLVEEVSNVMDDRRSRVC